MVFDLALISMVFDMTLIFMVFDGFNIHGF